MAPTGVFEGTGKDVGIRIWRVKDFNLVDEPKQNYGSFFSGDCYLVLDTFKAEGQLRHHVHFWLGRDTTADEAGSVAIFAQQLDDSLGGGPVQFRQPQGSESPEFLRLFPRLKIMTGGYATGFKDAAAAKGSLPVRLYQIKSPSRTCVQVFEVPCGLASLNHGDCFLLEDGGARQLWVWHGSSANIREKTRAIETANAFKEGTGIKLAVLDDGDGVSGEALAFFQRLGCKAPPEAAAIKDAEADKPPPAALAPPQLFKVDGGGSGFSQVGSEGQPLHRAALEPGAQLVLLAAGCIWVWTGHECAKPAAPLQVGGRFASSRGLPPSALVKAVKARFEPGLFTTYFADWAGEGGAGPGAAAGRDSFGNRVPVAGRGTDELPYNPDEAATAMQAQAQAADAAAGGAGAGAAAKGLEAAYGNLTTSKIQVWVMTQATALELPRQEVGVFYDGASYVVLHTYSTSKDTADLRYAVYTWQGRHCGNIEQGAAAIMAADMHRAKYAGRCSLVRVEQNLEPGHFVRLFKGTMIVRNGPRPHHQAPGRSPPGVHLYQVKGEATAQAHAVEVAAQAPSLCSGDCFVLERAPEITAGPVQAGPVSLWLGKGSSAGEQEVAAAVAAALAAGGAVARVEEGSEPADFWSALGGKAAYAATTSRTAAGPPKLFRLADCAGRGLKVEMSTSFAQDSLVNEDVMLLDTGAELFVWYGGACKHTERPRARDVAGRYLTLSGRSGRVLLVEVEAGQEPLFFTSNFPGWDHAAVKSAALEAIEARKRASGKA
ncbi:hypothetical protein HYH03_018200 [Edaphochlamys debaryana]|uniref:Gelsolin n=1 Tax=Edaphochlamys debaryana TaxID=47281 RepID=A0A836BN67_9CHLO|nr:hypothetical protein HYH03_018200 [Edaphochlamys debaryana]|eukprot:KAG2482921.1 hypothetical protein HYH03_018200 [Edaphochlamys debaryana]